jgi:hypothetical protein
LTYLLCQVGMGHIMSLNGLRNNKIDLIPTDYAGNLFIVLAFQSQSQKQDIINLSTTTRNPITLQQFL